MLKQEDLVPYVSAAIARCPANGLSTMLTDLLKELRGLIPSLSDYPVRAVSRTLPAKTNSVGSGTLETAALAYTETRAPRWAPDSDLEDVVNHVVVLCRRSRAIGVYTSDPVLGRLVRSLFGSADHSALGRLAAFEGPELNGAFLKGDARTVWMSGLHRRTAYKADSKILSGANLRAALDPLGDQTYRFTAARGSVAIPKMAGKEQRDIVVGDCCTRW